MYKKIIIYSFLAILGVFVLIFSGDNHKLYDRVKDFADKRSCENGNVDVALSDLTDFDWDKAVVYVDLMLGKEIEDAVGIKYDKTLDMSSGIVFVKDKKIVYEEDFSVVYSGPHPKRRKFFIEPYKNDDANRKVRVFARDAVFECFKYGSDRRDDYFSYGLSAKD